MKIKMNEGDSEKVLNGDYSGKPLEELKLINREKTFELARELLKVNTDNCDTKEGYEKFHIGWKIRHDKLNKLKALASYIKKRSIRLGLETTPCSKL